MKTKFCVNYFKLKIIVVGKQPWWLSRLKSHFWIQVESHSKPWFESRSRHRRIYSSKMELLLNFSSRCSSNSKRLGNTAFTGHIAAILKLVLTIPVFQFNYLTWFLKQTWVNTSNRFVIRLKFAASLIICVWAHKKITPKYLIFAWLECIVYH